MREDRQRVLAAARDPKPKSSSSRPDYDDDEGGGVASFLESSMVVFEGALWHGMYDVGAQSAADVRSAIRKEAEKARDIIKALQQVKKVLVGQATDPKVIGPQHYRLRDGSLLSRGGPITRRRSVVQRTSRRRILGRPQYDHFAPCISSSC